MGAPSLWRPGWPRRGVSRFTRHPTGNECQFLGQGYLRHHQFDAGLNRKIVPVPGRVRVPVAVGVVAVASVTIPGLTVRAVRHRRRARRVPAAIGVAAGVTVPRHGTADFRLDFPARSVRAFGATMNFAETGGIVKANLAPHPGVVHVPCTAGVELWLWWWPPCSWHSPVVLLLASFLSHPAFAQIASAIVTSCSSVLPIIRRRCRSTPASAIVFSTVGAPTMTGFVGISRAPAACRIRFWTGQSSPS